MEYEDQVLIYLQDQAPGWSTSVSKLTDDPDKFIKAVKYLITGQWLKNVCFTTDYKIIKKDEVFVGFKERLLKQKTK